MCIYTIHTTYYIVKVSSIVEIGRLTGKFKKKKKNITRGIKLSSVGRWKLEREGGREGDRKRRGRERVYHWRNDFFVSNACMHNMYVLYLCKN